VFKPSLLKSSIIFIPMKKKRIAVAIALSSFSYSQKKPWHRIEKNNNST